MLAGAASTESPPSESRDLVLVAWAARMLSEPHTLPELREAAISAELARRVAQKARLASEAQCSGAATSREACPRVGPLACDTGSRLVVEPSDELRERVRNLHCGIVARPVA